MSNSLRPHELQHARPPWPSPTPGVYSNSCPSSQICQFSICVSLFSRSRYWFSSIYKTSHWLTKQSMYLNIAGLYSNITDHKAEVWGEGGFSHRVQSITSVACIPRVSIPPHHYASFVSFLGSCEETMYLYWLRKSKTDDNCNWLHNMLSTGRKEDSDLCSGGLKGSEEDILLQGI